MRKNMRKNMHKSMRKNIRKNIRKNMRKNMRKTCVKTLLIVSKYTIMFQLTYFDRRRSDYIFNFKLKSISVGKLACFQT